MLKAFMKWLRGFLIITISGSAQDRFLNICARNNLDMWNVKPEDDGTRVYISRKNYRRMLPYVDKTGVELKVHDKRGLPFFFYKYRKRKCFALCLLLCICTIYVFTLFIWDINISGETMYTKEQIRRDIMDNYISLGTFKRNVDCAELEKELRARYDRVAWISCEIKGTQLNITLTETLEPEMIRESETPCNIVAVKDGLVTDIITRSGTAVVSGGDEVKKGDILITGVVNIYNDFDELLETQYLPSSGDVYAIIEYQYEDSFSMEYYDKEYDSKESKYYGIGFGENFFMPFRPKSEKNVEQVTEDKKLVLAGDFYLPLSIRQTVTRKYVPVLKKYTEAEAKEKAKKRQTVYLSDLRKKGVEILENNVTIEIVNGSCVASGVIVTREIIGIPSEINMIEQEGEIPADDDN